MSRRQYTSAQLDFELARRDRYPAASLRLPGFDTQAVTVSLLQAELDATPLDDPDRTWREWERALAERLLERFPGRTFVRVINLKHDKLVKIA